MKIKLFTFLFLLSLSHFALGQNDSLSFGDKLRLSSRDCTHSHICCQTDCPCCPNFPLDSLQIKFAQQIYSLEKTYLRETINPTDTISIGHKKYLLKFVERIGMAPTYNEYLQFASNITYSCTQYGNDYIVIAFSRNTGIPNKTTYFYEVLKED